MNYSKLVLRCRQFFCEQRQHPTDQRLFVFRQARVQVGDPGLARFQALAQHLLAPGDQLDALVATVLQIPLLWTDRKVMDAGVSSVTTSDWLALAYLIVFATAVAQQAWLFGVKGIGPSRASVLGNLTPVAAIGLSALILKESVGPVEMTGIGLILAGVWSVNRQTAKQP